MINLICALPCEAKPIIEHYKLKRLSDLHLYSTYLNKEQAISLTITGVGKQSAAAAVIHTYLSLSANKSDVWLNIGIAGHSTLPLGTVTLAHKVVDEATGKTWYPQILFNHDLITETTITIDKPSSTYPENDILDMEASGFFGSASKTGIIELTHSLKIISDNRKIHHKSINNIFVSNLIDSNMKIIVNIINELNQLSIIIQNFSHMEEIQEEIMATWHFTHSERLQLKKTLMRWQVLFPKDKPALEKIGNIPNSKQLLKYLQDRLDSASIHY